MANRTAKTRKGKEVVVGTVWKVDGGYHGYIMHRRGYAVLVFIPG